MFHVKQRQLLGLFLGVGLLGVLAIGCSSTGSRGWGAPAADDGTQLVSPRRGKLDGIDIRTSPTPAWTGRLSQQLDDGATKLQTSSLNASGTAFQGDMLQIGSEVVRVQSLRVNDSGRELTLVRGQDGTAAASHPSGTEVRAFRRPWRFPDDWNIPESSARSFEGLYGQPYVAADGVVFVGDYKGWLYAFKPDDVRLDAENRQGQPLAAAIKLGKPIIGGVAYDEASQSLFVASIDDVYKVSAADMRNRLSNDEAPVAHSIFKRTGGEIWATPVIADGKLLVASLDGYLYAIDLASGNEVWSFNSGNSLATTPVVEGDRVLVGGFDSKLYAVNIDSGELDWTFETENWIWGAPVVNSGIAYFGDFDGILHAVNVQNGTEAWSLALDRGVLRGSPAILNNNLVIGSDDGWLIGVNISNRERAWERDLGTPIQSSAIVAGSEVLIAPKGCVTLADSTARIFYRAVDPANGDLKQSVGVC